MHDVANLPGFMLAASLIIIVPGPATLLVAEQARQSGQRAAVAVAGIVCGDLLLIGLSLAGFAVLMQGLPWLLPALRLTGAAYLLYLGQGLLHDGRSGKGYKNNTQQAGSANFARGLLVTISNPKPILFFSSFFPLFIPSAPDNAAQGFMMLGLMFEMINLLYFAALCVLLNWAKHALAHQPDSHNWWASWLASGGIQQVCGGGLIVCGLGMALSVLC